MIEGCSSVWVFIQSRSTGPLVFGGCKDCKDTEKGELTKTSDYCVYCLNHSYIPVWVETFCGVRTYVSYLEGSYQIWLTRITGHFQTLKILRSILQVSPSCIETWTALWGMVCAEGENEPLFLVWLCNKWRKNLICMLLVSLSLTQFGKSILFLYI